MFSHLCWRAAVLALVAFGGAACTAQTAPSVAHQVVIQDSVVVTVLERPVAVEMTGPSIAYRGDVLTYLARAVDADGEPTPAFLVWSISDTTVARLTAASDSTATVETLATGTFTVRVEVGPLDSLRIGMIDAAGAFVLPEDDPENVLRLTISADSVEAVLEQEPDGALVLTATPHVTHETRQFCALFFSGSEVWAFSPFECVDPWMARVGPYSPPAGPYYRLAVYGVRQASEEVGGSLDLLAAMIRSSPSVERVALRRIT